jgi:hypothetical protein
VRAAGEGLLREQRSERHDTDAWIRTRILDYMKHCRDIESYYCEKGKLLEMQAGGRVEEVVRDFERVVRWVLLARDREGEIDWKELLGEEGDHVY